MTRPAADGPLAPLGAGRPRPQICLLLFAVAVFVFHQVSALAGEPAGDVIDLLTPFAVIAAAAIALISLEARGWILVAAFVAAILYVDGHGIHLSANSIGNESDALQDEDIVHFWDEIFSHIESVLGWFGLVACICFAEGTARPGPGDESSGRVLVLTSLLFGWAFFTAGVEGGTWPIVLATTALFCVWLGREARRAQGAAGWRALIGDRPLLSAATGAYVLAAAMIGGYAIWQGGVPQFTDAGLL